ncbi:MAG: Asp23/Gls24 family envelope stress response protein [Bacillaceae bacterium]
MVENNMLQMGEEKLGKVEIAPEVIEVIAGIATTEIEGVVSMRGSFASDVVERLGRKNHGKGVKVDLSEEGIKIDIFVQMRFGVSIPTVAEQVQENVRQALLTMTGLELKEVNVHIVGIQFDKQEDVE